jgi:hypothetical protein
MIISHRILLRMRNVSDNSRGENALNPWYFGAKVVYVHTPGTHHPYCKAIHDSLSVLPKLEKSQETLSNTLHMAKYCCTFTACTPLTQVPHVHKSVPRALRNIRHLHNWAQTLKVAAVSHSAIKCCKKDFKIQCCMLPSPRLVLCPSSIPEEVGDIPTIQNGMGRG